jgi:Protein of unknown function (DUF2934)
MPHDIAMCPGEDCPLRQDCYRFRGVVAARQDFFGATPYDHAAGTCDRFWDLARLRPSESSIREKAYYRWLAAGRPEGQADDHWKAASDELERAYQDLLRPLVAGG